VALEFGEVIPGANSKEPQVPIDINEAVDDRGATEKMRCINATVEKHTQ
jgi:hypothetical protein